MIYEAEAVGVGYANERDFLYSPTAERLYGLY